MTPRQKDGHLRTVQPYDPDDGRKVVPFAFPKGFPRFNGLDHAGDRNVVFPQVCREGAFPCRPPE